MDDDGFSVGQRGIVEARVALIQDGGGGDDGWFAHGDRVKLSGLVKDVFDGGKSALFGSEAGDACEQCLGVGMFGGF